MNDNEFTVPFPGSASTDDTHEFRIAPERIWACGDGKDTWWWDTPNHGGEEYIRAGVANAEIDMLRKALGTAGERINAQDAEIERLKKVAEQAVERANLRAATPEDNGYCELNQALPVWAHKHPELLGHLKEKEHG